VMTPKTCEAATKLRTRFFSGYVRRGHVTMLVQAPSVGFYPPLILLNLPLPIHVDKSRVVGRVPAEENELSIP
jgi:hypothetical protein